MFQTKVVQKITTDIFLENRAAYEIIWNNMAQPDRPLMTI